MWKSKKFGQFISFWVFRGSSKNYKSSQGPGSSQDPAYSQGPESYQGPGSSQGLGSYRVLGPPRVLSPPRALCLPRVLGPHTVLCPPRILGPVFPVCHKNVYIIALFMFFNVFLFCLKGYSETLTEEMLSWQCNSTQNLQLCKLPLIPTPL